VPVELSRPLSLAIEQSYAPTQPRHFGAPPATSRPFAVPGFSGAVATGASCNCNVITLNPHCNGTHTECVGHLTAQPLDAHKVVPSGLIPAVLLSITPEDAGDVRETSVPAPQSGDRLITRHNLERAWPRELPFGPRAVVVRTLPNDAAKRHRDYTGSTPPYLTLEAAELLVARGIEHLIVDLPSIDRSHDEGYLSAHRIFFGLPRGSTSLPEATRPTATVTELVFVPEGIHDGPYFLELQVPAIGGDAVPSRPLLYRLEPS